MKQLSYCLLILLMAGCKEAYVSPVQSPVTGYLVIEGVVNSSAGSTTIKLSRTTKLNNNAAAYETGAIVKLLGEDNSTYTFTEQPLGQYTVTTPGLNSAVRYRLSISVKTGKQYVSDFASVKNNPVIDSVSWKRENQDGVQIYINTHDPQNNTLYYQWEYDETWQIQSAYFDYLKYKITPHSPKDIYTVVYKDSTTFSFDPNIVNCWQFNSSSTILLGSTAKLSQDVVSLPLTFIPHATIKIGVLYSINVKQYAWTKDGFAFLENMKKNTESTGSIFDAQPSELKGNYKCVSDTTEPVIGYFNICPVQQKRIFISRSDVPGWNYNNGCYENEVLNNSDTIIAQALFLQPTSVNKMDPFGGIGTFNAAPPECVDCTLRGTNKKPVYWP